MRACRLNWWILVVMFVALMSCKQMVRTELNSNWTMTILEGPKEATALNGKTYKTTLPSVVHLQLLRAGDIQDPFFSDNAIAIKWISSCSVSYALTFSLSREILTLAKHELVFEGVDTYSSISLNGKVILKTENAFRSYRADVKDLLRDVNQLQVTITSTIKPDEEGQRENSMPFAYAHTRKACYQYSWDWAPYMNTLGLWKTVFLQSYKEIKFDYVWVRTRLMSTEKATINFAVALSDPTTSLAYQYEVKVKCNNTELGRFAVIDKYNYGDIDIINPELWWPNGIGKPFIYDFVVELVQSISNQVIDYRKIPYGIRSVQLDRKDNSFLLRINGYDIYSKGANYVPPDMFYPRLTNPQFNTYSKDFDSLNKIDMLLQDAVDSNFNMLRVWGGGQYQSDAFYQRASRLGLMIFHDFMFSDSIYPSSEKFLLNVEEEVKEQIRRIRNYPCLVLWSGNNQIMQGIREWGWNSQKYKDDYSKLFKTLIPKIVEYESSYISYIASSPDIEVNQALGDLTKNRGEAHYWGVWAGGQPFESYRSQVSTFNSQFGTQGMPVWETMKQMVDAKELNYDSKILLFHEKHGSAFRTLQKYIQQYGRPSVNFQLQTYQSGLIQAYGVAIAIKSQRAAKPKSCGTLYWQFNDAWPGISWSSIDYFGRWKPLHYMAKRLYADLSVFSIEGKVWVINDKLNEVSALVIIKVITFAGEMLYETSKELVLEANSALNLLNVTKDHHRNRLKDVLIYTEIVGGKDAVMQSTEYLATYKELELPEGQINVEYHPDFNEMTISSTVLVKDLYISHNSRYLKLSENYFDLVPGHVKKVLLIGVQLKEVRGGLRFTSYKQVYSKTPLVVKES